MDNKEITLKTLFDFMQNKFENIDGRFDGMDTRLDNMENRLNNMDIRITKIDADNKESHSQIIRELILTNNALTRMEADFSDKIGILFDAETAAKERMYLFSKK